MWIQKDILLNPRHRGFHLITDEVLKHLPEVQEIEVGTMQVFIKHTSASLCIQENASSDVMEDIHDFFTKIVPENPLLGL